MVMLTLPPSMAPLPTTCSCKQTIRPVRSRKESLVNHNTLSMNEYTTNRKQVRCGSQTGRGLDVKGCGRCHSKHICRIDVHGEGRIGFVGNNPSIRIGQHADCPCKHTQHASRTNETSSINRSPRTHAYMFWWLFPESPARSVHIQIEQT